MLENASKYRIQEKNAKVANRYIWLHKYGKSLHLKDKKYCLYVTAISAVPP